MEALIKKLDIKGFTELFNTEEKCLEYLSVKKWEGGFLCRNCGHTNYCKGRKPYSRRCTRCKREESATSHTIFHGCKIPLTDAFRMAYRLCRVPGTSTYELSRQFDTRQMTCWKFKKKVIECIENNGELKLVD